MPKRSMKNYAKAPNQVERPSGSKIVLALSLVPLIAGAILIVAWAMDFEWLPNPQDQIVVGTMFVLLSFAVSNAAQKKWTLGAGWALLLVADYLILAQRTAWIQYLGIAAGVAGAALVAMAFFRNIRAGNPNRTRSKAPR